jgi:hypothetical protein
VVEHEQAPGSGARDNGLRCAGYVAVGDLDPRVADAVLEALRTEGIAAYVAPTPAARGGYLEMHLPSRLTDRLYADSTRADRAGEVLTSEQRVAVEHGAVIDPVPVAEPEREAAAGAEPPQEIDFDSAWQQVLGSLQSTAGSPLPPWPVSEDVDTRTTQVPIELPVGRDSVIGGDPALEDHFVPPPPPPLPRLRRTTVLALLSILAGLVVLATDFDGGDLIWLAILAILGGGATLVWQVKEGPPTDSGWDDGAVV